MKIYLLDFFKFIEFNEYTYNLLYRIFLFYFLTLLN
jgi:hypothetical protein